MISFGGENQEMLRGTFILRHPIILKSNHTKLVFEDFELQNEEHDRAGTTVQ